jgi:hypothetical protein
MTREERHNRWRHIVDAQAASGQNIATWCRDNHIDKSYYYNCRRRVKEQSPELTGFIELRTHAPRTRETGVRLRLEDGVLIEVEHNFDPQALRAVVRALSKGTCSP